MHKIGNMSFGKAETAKEDQNESETSNYRNWFPSPGGTQGEEVVLPESRSWRTESGGIRVRGEAGCTEREGAGDSAPQRRHGGKGHSH